MRYASVILWIYNNINQNKKMLYKEAYTKVKFSSDLDLRNEFKLFPANFWN